MRAQRLSWAAVVAIGSLAVALFLSFLGGADAQSGGAVLIRTKADGQEVTSQVKVLTAEAEPREVAKGVSGRPISVPAGQYDVFVTCTDLIDHPTQQLRGLKIAGGTVERDVSFPAGTITLHVKMGGREVMGKELTILRSGEALPGTAKSGQAFKITPGTYAAEIQGGGRKGAKHRIEGIQSYDGAIRHIPVGL